MEFQPLGSLISALEYGTNVHICVVFLDHYGNEKTRLVRSQKIHETPVCNAAKCTPDSLSACFRCRNIVLKLVRTRKKAFGGFCINGVYEYCQPVILNDTVVAVVFVGNVLSDNEEQRLRLQKAVGSRLLKTMQQDFSAQQCTQLAELVASYILLLLQQYGITEKSAFNPLLDNINSYIEENILYDFSMDELASAFNYNEKYLGRLFKSKTGHSIKEYCNALRIENAKKLLTDSRISVADIAGQVGYNNVTYFNRVFKTVTGLSPRQYRQEHTSQ